MAMVYAVVVALAGSAAAEAAAAGGNRPANLVFILTDNQGPWTLGCYGNADIRTPHIDRLAAGGMRFTRAFASNAVCSPTRATLLTGLIPSQHGVHCFLDNRYMVGPQAYDTLAEFATLPKILAQRGYTCGLTGKWHLGANLTPHEGFSKWITMVQGSTREFYDLQVIEHGRIRKEPAYATELWTREATQFIRDNQARPFFLYLAYNGPYALGDLLRHDARNRHRGYYAGKPMDSFPRDAMHPWQFHNKEFLNNITSIRRVAAETSGVDDGVGEVLDTIEELGLAENTLVVYAADQGWMGGLNGLWGMGDHTRPIGAFDQMMQIPLIFRQPGRIPAGRTCDLVVANYDFLPTVLSYLGWNSALADTQTRSPGRDFSQALIGRPIAWENVVYYEMQHTRAIRTDRWKYVHRPEGPFELYDLAGDPHERFNLFGQPRSLATQRDLAARLDKFFLSTADPRYDLYRGGRSKASLVDEQLRP